MVSPLKVPRLGRTRRRVTDVLLVVAVLTGYAAGLGHVMPEYLFGGGLFYVLLSCASYRRSG